MKKLIMTKGLPGSGKSTWAIKRVEENTYPTKRVNKDDMRAMMDAGRWSRVREEFILKARDTMVAMILQDGYTVIVDDTNLAPKHEERLRQLAKENGAGFGIEDFTSLPVEECIKRDLKRLNSVGEKVIRDMWKKFLAPNPPVIEWNHSLPSCVVCDLDGTLCLMNGRGPFEGDKCDTDLPNKPVVDLVKVMAEQGMYILFVSGRFEAVRHKSMEWIRRMVLPYAPGNNLFMRKDGDTRKDYVIKREIYEDHIKDKYNVRFVIDDRNRVVQQWRELGLTVMQVADGDF